MKRKILFGIWIWAYLLCACLGHITQPTAAQRGALTVIGILFFLPGVLLLADAFRTGNRKLLTILRWICVASLALTLGGLLANLASVTASDAVGAALNEALFWVSAPMHCMTPRFLSLFLWASLFFASFVLKKPNH